MRSDQQPAQIIADHEMTSAPSLLVEDTLVPVSDDRKRPCTDDRPITSNVAANGSVESVEALSLSQVSSALLSPSIKSSPSISCSRTSGISDFKETELKILVEDEFVWELQNWRQAPYNERNVVVSPRFVMGGQTWSIHFGLVQKSATSTNIALHLAIDDPQDRQSGDWAVCAEIILALQNPSNSLEDLEEDGLTYALSQSSFHRFNAEESDWGFSHFCSTAYLEKGNPEFSVGPLASEEGAVNVIARIRIVKDETGVLWHNFNSFDAKKSTGFIGLLNQGATCYMNSFLQSIFLTNEFRSAVYRIPTQDCSPATSIPSALQRIFYKLQTGCSPSSTTELTKSFGWDNAESFMQHDVQEFSRVLLDDLENKMKGTGVEGTVERLFRGKLKNVLKCINVAYESTREESFYDLQLTIKGVKNLQESFERYVTTEMLRGDNQYRTDDFGLQDAKKFVTFEHFPPVLHIHLERYAFDIMAENTVKIHDRFEFPVEVSLDPYLSETSPDRETAQTYWLHSVLVHAGDGHGGHYFVYIRHPSNPDRWYKFDDTKVIPCTQKEAVDDNFGGLESISSEESAEIYRRTGVRPYRYRRFTSAYLLVYIRKSDLETVLKPLEESDVPKYLSERIKIDDAAESRRLYERQQQYLYANINILTESSIRSHAGADLFDPESPGAQAVKFMRDENITALRTHVIEDGLLELEGMDDVEVYHLTARRNKTLRPDRLVSSAPNTLIHSFLNRMDVAPVAFYLRPVSSAASLDDDLWHVPLSQGKVLIYVKWYDGGRLIPLGSVAIDQSQLISSITESVKTKLTKLLISFNEDTLLSYYEEFKPSKITLLQTEGETAQTFKDADLRHGDILIVEPNQEATAAETEIHHGPIEYFADLLCWRLVDVRPIDLLEQSESGGQEILTPVLQEFKIFTKWSYGQLIEALATATSLNSEYLRIIFTTDQSDQANPSSAGSADSSVQYIRTTSQGAVNDFLQGTTASDRVVIKYEVTPIPAKTAENQVRYRIQSGVGLALDYAAKLPKIVYLPPYVSKMSDLLQALDIPADAPVRLLECVAGRCRKTFQVGGENELLSFIKVDSSLVLLLESIEAVSSDSRSTEAKMISCFTFEKALTRPFGIPFRVALLPDEPVKALKVRLLKHLGLDSVSTPGTLFLCNWSRERKLDDENEVLTRIPVISSEDQLAIQILDPAKQSRSSSAFDGAIRFRSK